MLSWALAAGDWEITLPAAMVPEKALWMGTSVQWAAAIAAVATAWVSLTSAGTTQGGTIAVGIVMAGGIAVIGR